jgi:polyhydroxyalkanoate synthesis regulator phasin
MVPKQICAFALGGLLALTAAGVRADESALLDVLVKKGVLTQKEADKLAAEVSKEPVQSQTNGLASRLKIVPDHHPGRILYSDSRGHPPSN